MKNIKTIKPLTAGYSLILTAVLMTTGGCKNKDLEAFNNLEKDRFLVKTEKAVIKNIEDYLILVGSIKAMDEAVLYPRVSGKLLKNLLTDGDAVKKDQTVALIERDEPGVVYEAAPVPSTLNGVIGRVYQDTGASVTPQTPIALVVNQDQVRVVVDVPERYVAKVFINQIAYIKVDAFPETLFRGRVYRVSPVVDTKSRSSVIEILADNSKNLLKSGMFAEIRLVVGFKSEALAAPSAAVLRDEKGRPYIFVPMNNVAVKRNVTTGISNGDYVQISGGLKAGDMLITFGLYGLKDGSKIKIQD
ncbi:MAG: efflux RND transporter periplasmic adaptor subunit [Elusimicrobiota bacterium]